MSRECGQVRKGPDETGSKIIMRELNNSVVTFFLFENSATLQKAAPKMSLPIWSYLLTLPVESGKQIGPTSTFEHMYSLWLDVAFTPTKAGHDLDE